MNLPMAFSLQNLALVMHELKTFEAVKKKPSKLAISVKNKKNKATFGLKIGMEFNLFYPDLSRKNAILPHTHFVGCYDVKAILRN